jgi:uncharacterized membrane protein (UPF0127 family)
VSRFSLFAAAALALVACESQSKPPPPAPVPAPAPAPPPAPITDITAQNYVMPKLPRGRVTLTDAFGGKHPVDVEVAYTRDQRTRGLMWRTELPEGTGMLFIFNGDQYLSFWMKNTLIPLDMVFIKSDLSIVGIVERAEPKTLTSRNPGADSMYVLEIPSGWAQKIGLKPGLKVKIEGTQGLVPDP